MASALERLPGVLPDIVAESLSQPDLLSLMVVSQTMYHHALRALYRRPEIITLACSDPQYVGPHTPRRPCERKVAQYVQRAIHLQIRPVSLLLREDLTRYEASAHTLPNRPLASTHPLHTTNLRISSMVRQQYPVRPPPPVVDWIDVTFDHLLVAAYRAAAIIHAGGLRELSIQSDDLLEHCMQPVLTVLVDGFLNRATATANPLAPLNSVHTISVGNEVGGFPPDNLVYAADLSLVPNLRNLTVGYGTTFFGQPHHTLNKLVLHKWACRTLTTPQIVFGVPVMHNHSHLIAHRQLRDMIHCIPGLQHLEITSCRACNWLLMGYSYADWTDPSNPRIHVEAPFGDAVRTSLPNLRYFKMRTVCYSAGGNQGQWLYRYYYHDLVNWALHANLEYLEVDSWFHFLGPALGSVGAAIHSFPTPTTSFLPISLSHLKVKNLADGYIMVFYQYCRVILQEKMAGHLPNLRSVSYSFLNSDESFGYTPQLTIMQLRGLLRAAGVTLRRNG